MSKNTYTLYCLGCRGSYPVEGKQFTEYGGQTTCYVLKHGTHAVVLDCGTGLYGAEDLLSDCTVVDVLISHVHYDHVLGLLAMNVFPKDADRDQATQILNDRLGEAIRKYPEQYLWMHRRWRDD